MFILLVAPEGVGTLIEESVATIKQRVGVPIVLIDNCAPNLCLDSVVTENVQGTRLAVDDRAVVEITGR